MKRSRMCVYLDVVDFEISICPLGGRTYLETLFTIFGCIFLDCQPKRTYGDPFWLKDYNVLETYTHT